MDENDLKEVLEHIKERAKTMRRVHGECFFIANLKDIQDAWDAMIPLKTIWAVLHNEDKFPGKYDSFRKYAKKHLKTVSGKPGCAAILKRFLGVDGVQ